MPRLMESPKHFLILNDVLHKGNIHIIPLAVLAQGALLGAMMGRFLGITQLINNPLTYY